jgi:hypothetical protein
MKILCCCCYTLKLLPFNQNSKWAYENRDRKKNKWVVQNNWTLSTVVTQYQLNKLIILKRRHKSEKKWMLWK